jgi:hypothetical protein
MENGKKNDEAKPVYKERQRWRRMEEGKKKAPGDGWGVSRWVQAKGASGSRHHNRQPEPRDGS